MPWLCACRTSSAPGSATAGQPCFGNQPGVGPGQDGREQPVDGRAWRLHVQLANLDLLDGPFGADALEEGRVVLAFSPTK